MMFARIRNLLRAFDSGLMGRGRYAESTLASGLYALELLNAREEQRRIRTKTLVDAVPAQAVWS